MRLYWLHVNYCCVAFIQLLQIARASCIFYQYFPGQLYIYLILTALNQIWVHWRIDILDYILYIDSIKYTTTKMNLAALSRLDVRSQNSSGGFLRRTDKWNFISCNTILCQLLLYCLDKMIRKLNYLRVLAVSD